MQLGPYDTLPGSNRTYRDLGADGASVEDRSGGGKHVTVWTREKAYEGASRFSYDVDSTGRFVSGSAHYTDNASREMMRKMPW